MLKLRLKLFIFITYRMKFNFLYFKFWLSIFMCEFLINLNCIMFKKSFKFYFICILIIDFSLYIAFHFSF